MRITSRNPLVTIASKVQGLRSSMANQWNLIGQPHDFYITNYNWSAHRGFAQGRRIEASVEIEFSEGTTADLSRTAGVRKGGQISSFSLYQGGAIRAKLVYKTEGEPPLVMWSEMEDMRLIAYLDTIGHTAHGFCMCSPHKSGAGNSERNRDELRKYSEPSARASELLKQNNATRLTTHTSVF